MFFNMNFADSFHLNLVSIRTNSHMGSVKINSVHKKDNIFVYKMDEATVILLLQC